MKWTGFFFKFYFNDFIILELCVCPHHNKSFVVIPVQVSPCWLLPCLCRQEWVYSRKCCIKNMENTPRRPSSTMCVFFLFFFSCNILEAATVVLTAWDSKYFTSLSLHSTVCLCQASCSSPQTSTITASTSARAVSPSSRNYVVLENIFF